METKKVLLIVGGIVGGLFLIGAGAFAYSMYWLYGAGDQADTAVAIGERSVGYARWVASEEDPGINETLTKVAELLSKAQGEQENLPAPLRSLMDMHRSQQKSSLKILWPRSMTASFERSEEDVERFNVAINLRGMGGIVKSMFKMLQMDGRALEYRDHQLTATGTVSEFVAALHGSTILVSSDVEELKSTIDRIVDEQPLAPPPALASLEKIIAPGSDFYLVYDAPSGIDGLLGVAFDVESADRWRGVALVRAASPEALPAAAEQTARLIDDVMADLAARGVELSAVRSDVDPRTARFDLTATHVTALLDRAQLP